MDPSLYLDRDTWVHRLDPRTKIFLLLGMFALPFVFLNPLYELAVLALLLFVEREALLYGFSNALRIVITVIAGMFFLSTTRNEEVGIGLVRLKIPYRFAFAVSTALRLVPTVVATGLTIGQAQRSRGLDLESGNIIQRIRKHLPLLVPVFVTTVRSTNVFSMALESKGFGARPERTYCLRTAMSGRDALVIVGFGALLAGCIALRLAGYGGLEGFSR